MLSLLAGPVAISPLDPLESAVVCASAVAVWCDDRGLYVVSDTGSTHLGELYVLHVNGKAVRVGWRLAAPAATLGWSAEDALAIIGDPTGAWVKCRLPATASIGAWHPASTARAAAMADRKLVYVPAGQRVESDPYDDTGGALATEYTFPAGGPAGAGPGMLLYAGRENAAHLWWCLDCGCGGLRKYDATNRTIAPGLAVTSLGAAVVAAGYSIKHRIFVAVRRGSGHDDLYVYGADDPVADSMSAVSLTPSARRGGMSLARVRVIGDLSEPCAARNVRFSAAEGAVDQEVVATDGDGYAATRYFAPIGRGALTGHITATLEE